MPCAIAFQVAWVTAAQSTAMVTDSGSACDTLRLLRQAEQEPSGLLSRQVFALSKSSQARPGLAASLGPVPAALIVRAGRQAASGTLDATTCCSHHNPTGHQKTRSYMRYDLKYDRDDRLPDRSRRGASVAHRRGAGSDQACHPGRRVHARPAA